MPADTLVGASFCVHTMKHLITFLAVLVLSGCLPIRMVKDLPVDGQCERLAVLDASGKDQKQIRSKLERKAEKAGANLLLFNPEQLYEITLTHSVNSSAQSLNGVGIAYKCTYN